MAGMSNLRSAGQNRPTDGSNPALWTKAKYKKCKEMNQFFSCFPPTLLQQKTFLFPSLFVWGFLELHKFVRHKSAAGAW